MWKGRIINFAGAPDSPTPGRNSTVEIGLRNVLCRVGSVRGRLNLRKGQGPAPSCIFPPSRHTFLLQHSHIFGVYPCGASWETPPVHLVHAPFPFLGPRPFRAQHASPKFPTHEVCQHCFRISIRIDGRPPEGRANVRGRRQHITKGDLSSSKSPYLESDGAAAAACVGEVLVPLTSIPRTATLRAKRHCLAIRVHISHYFASIPVERSNAVRHATVALFTWKLCLS